MEDTPTTCKYCNRRYTRSSWFKRHETTCMMRQYVTQKSKRVVDADAEEEEDVMPISTVNLIVKELAFKMAKMEEDIAMLKKWANKEKTRVDVIQWLNEHESEQMMPFVEWYKKTFVITRQHLELVFKHDIISAIPYIMENLIGTEMSNIPIKCFEQKTNVLYVFRTDKTWGVLSMQDFTKFVDHVHNKLILENIKWQKENKSMLENDSTYKEYLENNLKVLAGKYEPEYMCTQIRNKIYNYLKYNLNSVHEYEFVF